MKCSKCSQYTIKEKCCDVKTINPKPAKYSPEDKYGDYRRTVKKSEFERAGLL